MHTSIAAHSLHRLQVLQYDRHSYLARAACAVQPFPETEAGSWVLTSAYSEEDEGTRRVDEHNKGKASVDVSGKEEGYRRSRLILSRFDRSHFEVNGQVCATRRKPPAFFSSQVLHASNQREGSVAHSCRASEFAPSSNRWWQGDRGEETLTRESSVVIGQAATRELKRTGGSASYT